MSYSSTSNPRLEAAIVAHPDDDAPRLAYADWFEKNGQPERARFIRLQCQLAHDLEGGRRTTGMSQEARRLCETHANHWLDDRPTDRGIEWRFHRGFPDHVIFNSFTILEKYQAEVLR